MATEFKLNYTGAEINEKLAMVDETKNTLANYYYTSIDIDNKFSENENQTNIKFDDVNSNLEEVDTKFGQIDSELEEIATKTDEHDSRLESIDNKLNENDTTFENINIRFDGVNSNLLLKADLVDGKVPAEQLPDDIGGGASSWNDFEDKPFGASVESVALADNLSFTSFDVGGFYAAELELSPYEIGDTISVLFDGVSYEFTKQYNEELEVYPFGNLSILNIMGYNFEDTGEPFVFAIAKDNDSGICEIYLTDTQETTHTISISTVAEIIETLDIKYLPSNMALGYEEKSFDDITWNGVATDKEIVTILEMEIPEEEGGGMGGYYTIKIQDTPLSSANDIIGATYATYNDGEGTSDSEPITSDVITTYSDNLWGIGDGFFPPILNVTALPASIDLTETELGSMGAGVVEFPSVGLYFFGCYFNNDYSTPMMYTADLKGETTLVQIDEKFIPDTIARQSDLDNIDLSSYYTKSETYSKSEVDTALDNVSVDLSGYYTKDETYSKSEVDTAISNIDLSNYYMKSELYNKAEVDTAIENIDLSNYYTKSETYNKSEVYSKTEIDEITGDINTILDEISALIGE